MLLLISFFAHGQMSWIAVQGNSFIDETGKTIVFSGMNTSDPDKLEKDGQWTDAYFDAIKTWGSNLVRFPVHPRAWRERGEEEYIKLLDRGIALAEARGLYVIIDWHSIGNLKSGLFQHEMYETSLNETMKFWATMAKRYGDNPTVAFFELYNEPTTYGGQLGVCTWPEWKSIMEEVITIIRAHGAKNIPLVAGFNWAYDLTPIELQPIDAEGIAYVAHPYPQKRTYPWREAWQADWAFVADKYPVILTEVGYCGPEAEGAHIPVVDDGKYVDYLLDFTAEKSISYVIWVFDPQWSPMLIEDFSYKPTPAGRVWKESLAKRIKK